MERIYAVIVTYHPEADFPAHLAAILPQVEGVVVVHNGGDLPALPAEVTLIANSENKGLAAAQNQGILAALAKGAEWILLLDDDSAPAPDMIAQMQSAYAAFPEPERLGLIAPRVYDRAVGKTYRHIRGNRWWCWPQNWQNAKEYPPYLTPLCFAIASGSLMPAHVFAKLGLMREDFFIDHIDTEWCARLLSAGYTIMAAPRAALSHALASSTRQGAVVRKNYAPERYFTQSRNLFVVIRQYLFKAPALAAISLVSLLCETYRVVRHESQKQAKLSAIVSGIRQSFSF